MNISYISSVSLAKIRIFVSSLCWCVLSHVHSSWLHGLQPTRLLCPGFPRSGLPLPPPGDLPTPGMNLHLLHCRQILYLLSHQGSLLSAEYFFSCNLKYRLVLSKWTGYLQPRTELKVVPGSPVRWMEQPDFLRQLCTEGE